MDRPRSQMPAIVAGVITYNPNLPQLRSLLASLLLQECRVVLFDNGSQNSAEIISLCSEFANAHVQANKQNIGIAKAANEIAKVAREKEAQFLLLFDQDSVPSEKYIESLLAEFARLSTNDRKIAAISGAQVCSFAGRKSPFVRYGNWLSKKIYFPEGASSGEVDFLITSGCLFSLDSFYRVGPFDEALFIDNVDVEWCCRAKSKGYSLIGCQTAEFSHSIGDRVVKIGGRVVLRVHSPLRTYYSVRNLLALSRRNYISRTWKINSIIRAVLKAAVMTLISRNRAEYLKHLVRGISSSRSIPRHPTF